MTIHLLLRSRTSDGHQARHAALLGFAAVLLISVDAAHGQSPATPTCAPNPTGCNSVTSDDWSNTAMGTGALAVTAEDTSGAMDPYFISELNTAAGYSALGKNVNGNNNSAFGALAMQNNLLGANNTAVGYAALVANVGALSFETGNWNTAVGAGAVASNTQGNSNTGIGTYALQANTVGNNNTAIGGGTDSMKGALGSNTTGGNNIAVGVAALASNTTASGNTAVGFSALTKNVSAGNNSAFGSGSLQNNDTGNQNTAAGSLTLFSNTSGNYNAALGYGALQFGSTASNNTAAGYRALYQVTSGNSNTATGFRSSLSNTTGQLNTAVGSDALRSNTAGSSNIAVGASAGYAIIGSNNIDIGAAGTASDNGVIRIGGASNSAVFLAGVTSAHLAGSPVYISANGQLGLLASSEQYKSGVTDLFDTSEKLMKLRPVTYTLKGDPDSVVQVGLIAEEVAEVMPELVVRDSAGTIQGVRYDELAPVLVREFQRQHEQLQKQSDEILALQQQANAFAALKAQMEELRSETRLLRATFSDTQRAGLVIEK